MEKAQFGSSLRKTYPVLTVNVSLFPKTDEGLVEGKEMSKGEQLGEPLLA